MGTRSLIKKISWWLVKVVWFFFPFHFQWPLPLLKWIIMLMHLATSHGPIPTFHFAMTSSEGNYNADASSHFSWSHPYFSFSMTSSSSEVNYNADASSHFSWSHPYFSFSMTPSSSEVNYNVNERDFFHFYKQVQIPTSV